MAATIVTQRSPARAMTSVLVLTGDASYPTGGYALTARDFGFTELSGCFPQAVRSGTQHLVAVWDPDTEKLLFAYPTGGGEDSPAAPAAPYVRAPRPEEKIDYLQREPFSQAEMTPEDLADVLDSNDLILSIPDTLVPGGGKELAGGTDLSAVSTRILGIGY